MLGKSALFLLTGLFALSFQTTKPHQTNNTQKQLLKRIVIDPGHGGSAAEARKFYGASGKHMEEKDVALAIGLQLEKDIHQQMPDVEVVMTRTTDVFDHPVIKANKANAAHGDLFISIHCNDVGPTRHRVRDGYTTKTVTRKGKKTTVKVPKYRTWYEPNLAKGTETYIWGVGKTKEKEEALSENNFIDSSLLIIDKNESPAMKMINSMRTQEYAKRSRALAETIEDEFTKSGRVSRGAKQRDEAGIWVLQAVAMPAVLVEVGFLSNPEEEEYITSKEGQKEVSQTIVRALKRYQYSLEKLGSGGK